MMKRLDTVILPCCSQGCEGLGSLVGPKSYTSHDLTVSDPAA